ncbi:MAG: hypothetical protein LBL06_02485 [Treponema sp.]|nr:hypothetical protein [Treponema sp.]
MPDFFPMRDADLVRWLENFCSVLAEHAEAWGISTSIITGLTAQITAYIKVYDEATGENSTKALVLEKNEKRDALKAEVRDIKNQYVDYNTAVTNPDRERLGLHIRDRHPTPKPRPTSRPSLEITPTNNRQHTGIAINKATGKKTKPADAYGVRYAWEIRDNAPINADDLRHSTFRRKVSQVFNYSEEERGKKIFYAACYENEKGEAGPWSDIIETIIP